MDDLLEQERFEKSIFVKAALQLLLERASVPTVITTTGSGSGGGNGTTQEGAGLNGGGGNSGRLHGPGEEGAAGGGAGLLAGQHGGVIKSGYLKKAAHHSMGTIWKTKQVEIHPGLFVYEDDDNLLGRRYGSSLSL